MKWPWWIAAVLLAVLTRWFYVAEIKDYVLFQVPLVDAEEYRSRGVQPVLLEDVNHFFSRRLGAQPPEPADLQVLTELALAFILAGD